MPKSVTLVLTFKLEHIPSFVVLRIKGRNWEWTRAIDKVGYKDSLLRNQREIIQIHLRFISSGIG